MPARPWSALHASSAEQADRFQRQGSGDSQADYNPDGTLTITPTFWDSRFGRFIKRAGAVTGITTVAAPLIGSLVGHETHTEVINGELLKFPSRREMAGAGALVGLGLSAIGALFIPFMQPEDRFAKERYEKDHKTKLLPTTRENVYAPVASLNYGESIVMPARTLAQEPLAARSFEGGATAPLASPQIIGGASALPSAYVVNSAPDYGYGGGGYGGGYGGGGFGGNGGFLDGAGNYLLYSTLFDGLGGRGRYGGYGVDTVVKNRNHHHYYNANGEHVASYKGGSSANPFSATSASSRPARRPWFTSSSNRGASRSWGGSGGSSQSSRSSRR